MDFLGDISLPTIISTILGGLFAVWGGAKIYFKKIWKAVDEAEDVITESAVLMKEVADIPAAFVNLAEVKDDGSVVFKPENWALVKKEVEEVQVKLDNWKTQLTEAIDAIKAVFKKTE
jgi:hypothetical protein